VHSDAHASDGLARKEGGTSRAFPALMAAHAPDHRDPSSPAASGAILAAVSAFVVLAVGAMGAYPGGSTWDPSARGNSFWLNYLCDLERAVAINGEPNAIGSALARAAIVVLGVGLAFFWWHLPVLMPAHARLGRAIRLLGSSSLVATFAVAFFPGDRFATLHPLLMLAMGGPALGAALLAVLGLTPAAERLPWAARVGSATVLVSSVDFALYVRQLFTDGPDPIALAVLERVSVILAIAWMTAVALALRTTSRW
jgi:hypothetical protein